MLLRLACLALLALHVSAAQYTVFHRFAAPGAKFVRRGVVTVDGSGARYEPAADTDVAAGGRSGVAPWYQVAVLVDGDYVTTSTPSCFATEPAELTLHLTSGRPSSVEYKPRATGACDPAAASAAASAASLPSAPLSVAIKNPHLTKSPPLASPSVVAADGTVVEPEPEKTFLQKYWMAIVAALLIMATLMSDEPPKEGARAARGQGGAAPRLQ